MNEILARALSFTSQTSINQNLLPRQSNAVETDEEQRYQEKYILALEEKLKITQERDTMIRILQEKNSQLEALMKYSAELERKLGISAGDNVVLNVPSDEKSVAWLDVVRKYFASFNGDLDLYDQDVIVFLNKHNLLIEKVESCCSPGVMYIGIPASLHVEFAAYFSDIWQKGLHLKGKSSTEIDRINITNSLKDQNLFAVDGLKRPLDYAKCSPSKEMVACENPGEESMHIDNPESTNSQLGSKSNRTSRRTSERLKSFPGKHTYQGQVSMNDTGTDNNSSCMTDSAPRTKMSSNSSSTSSPSKKVIRSTDDGSLTPKKIGRIEQINKISPISDNQFISSDGISPRSNNYHNSMRFSPSRKLLSDELDLEIESPYGIEKNQGIVYKKLSPGLMSPRSEVGLKEIKFKGITMYIWLDFLNFYFPDAVKDMKNNKELFKFIKSGVQKFLADNYPSIGLSLKDLENSKLMYIPKPFEITFKSWFREFLNSQCTTLKQTNNPHTFTYNSYENDQENVSSVTLESDADDNIVITEGSSVPASKKSKPNIIRYNIILKDLFSDFNAQPKSSRARIRNSVKEYLLEKVGPLDDCKLLQKDKYGAVKISYGIPREHVADFQKWSLVQLRHEYGDKVPLADWER